MSAIVKYTVDALGFVPRLWEIWTDPVYGTVRCIEVEKLGKGRAFITAEVLPKGWKVR